MRTSFHTGFLADCSAAQAARLIREHGYDEVELNGEELPWAGPHVTPATPAAERRELARLGPYSALSAHHADLGADTPDVQEAALAWTRGMMELAVDLGIEVVHVIPGGNSSLRGVHRGLEACLALAGDLGLRLGLEPIVNQAIAGREGLLEALERLPELRVNFDPSHLQVTDGDVVETAGLVGARTDHVAIKDATGTPDDWAFVALGTGDIDFVAMLRRLRAHGYDGTLSVEHESHVFGGDDRGVEQVLDESLAFVRTLIDDVEDAA